MALGWDDLIDNNAKVRFSVLKGMARQMANARGGLSPRNVREALRDINERIPMLVRRKRKELGMAVSAGVMVDMGHRNDGFCREA